MIENSSLKSCSTRAPILSWSEASVSGDVSADKDQVTSFTLKAGLSLLCLHHITCSSSNAKQQCKCSLLMLLQVLLFLFVLHTNYQHTLLINLSRSWNFDFCKFAVRSPHCRFFKQKFKYLSFFTPGSASAKPLPHRLPAAALRRLPNTGGPGDGKGPNWWESGAICTLQSCKAVFKIQ